MPVATTARIRSKNAATWSSVWQVSDRDCRTRELGSNHRTRATYPELRRMTSDVKATPGGGVRMVGHRWEGRPRACSHRSTSSASNLTVVDFKPGRPSRCRCRTDAGIGPTHQRRSVDPKPSGDLGDSQQAR